MKFKDFIQNTVKTAETIIVKVEEYKELTNQEKKQRVDEVIGKYVSSTIDYVQINFLFKLILKKYLLPNVPVITQAIFDLIKTRVEGITK